LAKASEQFRQSDVTIWGVVALLCASLAVFGSNISLLVPQSLIGGLNQPRFAGASIEALRQQVSQLQQDTGQLRRENELLVSRFTLQEREGNEVVRRVGALEVSVPKLLEAIPDTTLVDRNNLTASIGENQTLTFDAQGGSVAVRQSPLPGTTALPPILDQPLPEPVEPQVALAPATPAGYGIAVGAAVEAGQTSALWSDLTLKLGPLLFGLTPLVTDTADGTGKRIVVGPISDVTEARALCERFERVAIACMPTPYGGEPLNQSE
jgi:hypothetical protein